MFYFSLNEVVVCLFGALICFFQPLLVMPIDYISINHFLGIALNEINIEPFSFSLRTYFKKNEANSWTR